MASPQNNSQSSTFYDLIINSCSKEIQIANLYNPLKTAKENPETGVKIITPSAKFVIRDAAKLAFDFLPLYCFCMNPDSVIAKLQKNVTKKQLNDFLKDSETSVSGKILLEELLERSNTSSTEEQTQPLIKESSEFNIYGNYGYGEAPKITSVNENTLEILCKLFAVVK